MDTERIPLFPLDVVLLPGKLLPLHIFEPRYRLMIRECIEAGAVFGVVLARENQIASVGCTAEIVEVGKTYDDGRMDTATVGRSAYKIHDVHGEKDYLEGTVEFLADDLQPGSAEVASDLRERFDECYRLLHGEAPPTIADDASISLAYQIAGALPLDLETLQRLLEIRVEAERRELLAEQLKELVGRLKRLRQARSKAAANGHGTP